MELMQLLHQILGKENAELANRSEFTALDATDAEAVRKSFTGGEFTTVYQLVAMLSAKGEN